MIKTIGGIFCCEAPPAAVTVDPIGGKGLQRLVLKSVGSTFFKINQ